MQVSSKNPFKYGGNLSSREMEDESLDHFMRELHSASRLHWQFMSVWQILALPVMVLLKRLTYSPSHAGIVKICGVDVHLSDLSSHMDESDIDRIIRDRRRSENAIMRNLYETIRSKFVYHTMPRTVKTRRITEAA